MSDQGKKPNLLDLTSRLGQIQQQVNSSDPASQTPTENTGEVRRYVKIEVSDGKNVQACDSLAEGNASATYVVQGSTETEEEGSPMKEFVHEVEFQHNTLLGKMQMLREVLAKQLNQSPLQASLNQAQKDSNPPQTGLNQTLKDSDQAPVDENNSHEGQNQMQDFQNPTEIVQNPTLIDEREDIQKKTFAKWINSQLAKGKHAPVTDLFYDLRDGTRLLALLEVLTNETYKREKGRMRVHHLNNVSRALAILEENNVKLVNISNEHIVDGSAKLTLGLVWAIILHWQVQGVLKDVMSDLQQTNLEKTLLAWCRQTTKGYHGVDVQNFTTSWTDGLAFNALIHSHRPHLFDWTVLARKHPYARLENAFRVAHEHLSIERLLDPEDVNSQVPDKKSIMMYVMCLFQVLPHATFTMESLDLSVQSDSSFSVEVSSEDLPAIPKKNRPLSNVSIGLGEYQHTLEEVLTWLLGAEDRLAAMPPIAETTDEVKDQFHDLEDLMLELTSKQGGIGDVLGEGSRLLREGVMEEEEEDEVRVQMKLLNTRWEELRVKAMDRQSKLHEKLMALQHNQLDSLKRWLTETEDRIANMSQVGPTLEALAEQITAHQNLQADLEKEQSNINSLSNMVVVVDESSSDAAYSSLEDELNALGERWAHICKWTESRWSMLQNLSVYWKALDQGIVKMRQWMDEKESLLRQVESNPSTEQEHILQQASMLQVLQAELEVQQRCLGHLQEHSANVSSHLPPESDIHEKISVELENIQDRMDILVSIIEAQTQRLAASGIDISKVVIPGKDSTDIVSSSTTTITNEGGTVVTKIITTKVVTTETVEVEDSGVKRQKLEGSCQEDFSVALHQLGGWMDMIEKKTKPKPIEELSLEQLMQLVQQLESEMETQKEEYYKVVSLGQSAISETSTIGESSQESEKQVVGITTRWEALVEMLVEIRMRVTYITHKNKISTDLSNLEVQYQEFLSWCDDVGNINEKEPNEIKLQLEECQSKLGAMKSQEEEIRALMTTAESLEVKWTQETQIIIEQIKIFLTKWEVLVQRLLECKDTLTQKAEEVKPASVTQKTSAIPPESLLKAIDASREWLCSLETAIASECVVATLPQMQDTLEKFKDLCQKVDTEQGNMAYINDACNTVSKENHPDVIDSVTKLNNQWELTTSDLRSRIKTIEKLIERQKQYNDEVTGLKSWLAEVDVFLQAEEAALGDIETLEAQLEQSNALQDDIATLQNNFNNISTTGKQLLEEGNIELKTMVKSQLEELTGRWNTVTEQARVQNKSLKEALAKSQKVHEDIEKLNAWLEDVEKRIPSSLNTDKEEELNSAIETFSQLRDDISKHSEDFRALNNIGDEMLQLDAAATHEDLARQFTQLNGRWTEVVSQVDSKYKTLTNAAQHYEDFKKCCAEEKDWLDQLQAGLEKSTKSAADAEEISEALDELEIFLHSHNEERLEQIRKLAESLVSENVMADTVQKTTQSLSTRFETLNAQASEQQSGLEGRVQEAQAWEREYISVLDYLAQSDLLLTQAVADPDLQVDHVQVQSELALQEEVLKKMQKQVEVYHSQGKSEAAVRLEDQVTHLLKKYEEIEMKLRLVQKPSDFDERLENVSKQLQGINEKVHLTSLGSGNPDVIQEQLNQCMSLYQLLSEIKAEVENVIATGRKIVKDGQSTDPDGLTQQLDQLKALYNQLGGSVTEQRSALERTLRHSRKVQKDAGHLEEWLTTTECELDQREATVPTKCIQVELHFAQHAIDDLGRKKPLLTGLHESYAALASVCDDSTVLQPVKEQVDDIALTWERVSTRLTNRLKNMQSEQISKEADMEKFIVGLGEIKGWLESTEHQLGNLSKMDANDQAKLIKAVASEVQNYKAHIENIRDTAVDLINHGTLFQARVQPELVQINQRWENIFKTVQQSSQDTQDTVGDTLVLETHEPIPSAGLTNTTSSLSTITDISSVKETAFLTSLTSDSSQLNQPSGIIGKASEVLSSQVKDKEEKKQFPVQDSHPISGDVENSSINPVGEQRLLKSIDLVRNVMSTTTTFTTSTISSSKLFYEPSSDSNNHIQCKEGSQLEETVSADMGSSADSSLWGDSPMVDSVIKVEKKTKPEVTDHSAEMFISPLSKDLENSPKTGEESTVKEDSQLLNVSEDKNSVNIIEVEEVKMTISHLSFNIPSSSSEEKICGLTKSKRLSSGVGDTSSLDSSSRDVSPVPEYPPDESSLKDRKRKITESETDLDNFDDLIAGLKEVAEKDIDLTAIEKARRRNSEKEMDLDHGGDERFSLLKIRRRDDDDLESLASVDTDMAPASETSRDFEATFSDLESVSESVSSKGDSLFSPSVTQSSLSTSKIEEVRTVEHISQRAQIVTSESVTHPFVSNARQLMSPKLENDTNLSVKYLDEVQHKRMEKEVTDNLVADTPDKPEVCHEVNIGKDYEQLPVEKLQAMIAELEEVMSDTELSDSESETKNAVKEESDKEAMSSMKDSKQECNLGTDDVVMKEVDSKALPIEFKIQEVHVGDIEFAQAKGSYEKSLTVPLEMPFKVRVSSTPVCDDSLNQSKDISSELSKKSNLIEKKSFSGKDKNNDNKEQGSAHCVQKVSVQSSQVVHGMTLVSSTENRLPEAEEAVLVTLISRSSSAEAIATDSESTESKNNLVMEQVREEKAEADTDDDAPDFDRNKEDDIMHKEGLEKNVDLKQHDTISNKVASAPTSFSSNSSSDDVDTKKTRRPTVIECPVGLNEELPRTDVKVKCEEYDGSLNYVSLKEADDDVSHDKVNTEKVKEAKEQAVISNVKETDKATCITIDSDVGIKKRKRFAKIYEEGDSTILTEMTKDVMRRRHDPEEKKVHSAQKLFESKSDQGAIAKETLITPDSIEKALLRKGLMERREVGENWELSSSSSSISQSKRGSSTEGSVDFGSETRGTLSGDWDDAPVVTNVNMAEEVPKIPEGSMAVIDELEESEDIRFSFLSSNSIDTDREDIFTNEIESETLLDGEGNDSSSSDESDSPGESSTTRISAATIYEQAVIQALEGSGEKHLIKKDEHECKSTCDNETTQVKSAVVEQIKEANKICFSVEKEKVVDGGDNLNRVNAQIMSMSMQAPQTSKDVTDSEEAFKGTGSSSVLPPKDDVVEIVYEVVTVTRSKVVAVPEMATILHLPDESDVSEETDVSEEQKHDFPLAEMEEKSLEVSASEQGRVNDDVKSEAKLISTCLISRCKDSFPRDNSERAKSLESKINEGKGKEGYSNLMCDQEDSNKRDTDVSYRADIPQYSESTQRKKEMSAKNIARAVSPSLIIDITPVDVDEETKEASEILDKSTGKWEGYKVSCRDQNKPDSLSIDDDDSTSSLEELLTTSALPFESAPEEANKRNYLKEDIKKITNQPGKTCSEAHANIEKMLVTSVDKTFTDNADEEPLKMGKCRKLSITSSSSSGSSFEMVDNEVDLEDQLSLHESYSEPRNEGKENHSENGSESDEGLDTLEEPDTFELQKGLGPSCIPLDVKLERHVSIDSSVSTLSEAETVIHVPIGSLSQADTETTSIKDDSQIGVKAVKRGDVNESLIRSVSEELILKSDSENELLSKEESSFSHKKEAVHKERESKIEIDNKEASIVMGKTDVASSEDYVIIMKEKSLKGEIDQAFVCATISPIEDDISPDSDCSGSVCSPFEILDNKQNVSRHVVYDSSKSEPSPSKLQIPSIFYQSENIRQTSPKKSEKSIQHIERLDIVSKEKLEAANPKVLDKESTLNTIATVGDTGQQINDIFEGDDWINIGVMTQNKNKEKRGSVDVAQVIQTTEVSEEQEVSISIPDIQLEDSKEESFASSDDETNSKVIEITKGKDFSKEHFDDLSDLQKSTRQTKEFQPVVQRHKTLKDPLEHGKAFEMDATESFDISIKNDTKGSSEDKTKNPYSSCLVDYAFEDDRKAMAAYDDKLSEQRDKEEAMVFRKCVLKDSDFVVVDESSVLKVEENRGKESSSSCDTSNSTGSSPYYDASGEMVESLGSDEVSSSMEVLHSSAEILDMPLASWTSNVDLEPTNNDELNEVSDHGPVPHRESKKIKSLCNEQDPTAPSRFSTISACTDASEEVIFSETEGEEFPYEDTTDDDLTLEEEAIKELAEKHKEASQSTTQTLETVTSSKSVFAARTYVKETTIKQTKGGEEDAKGYLAEVSRLADKIGELRNKAKVAPSYEEALEKAEALEQEVAELEPDIATIISRGDTLTLTTHMVDVQKANTIRTAVNDLRNHWSALKSETEGVKANSEKVNEEVNVASKKADDIVNWINDVSKRLHLVNNDESQLQVLEKEMAQKKEELDDLNTSGALLKKYKYNHLQPILTLLNTRWTEISMQFRQYRKVSLEKKTIVSSSKLEAEVESTSVPDFVASVNRLREAISAISRQLSTNKLAGNHYDNLKGQEEELKSIKSGIETLKPRLDGLEEERNATIKNVTPVQSEQVRRVMDKLREEWAQVNRGYTERHSHWLQCSENWRMLQKTTEEFSVWLTSIEEKVQATGSQPLPEAKMTQKELEKQVTLKHRPSQTLQSTCKEITDAINPEEGKRLQERVDSLMKRWRSLLLDLAARREKIAGEEGSKEGSNVEYDALVTWVDQAQALMDAPVNVTDEASLSAHTTMVQNHLIEITTKQNLLKKLKDSKTKTVTPQQMTLLETNMSKVAKSLPHYKNMMDTKLGVIKTLVTDVEDLYKWTEEMRVKTALHNLTEEEIKLMKITLHEKEVLYENLDSTYWVLAQDAETKGLTVAVGLKNRMNTIESRLKALQGQVLDASERGTSTSPSTSPTFSRITPAPARGTEKADEEKVVQEKQKVEVKEMQLKPEIKKTEMRPVSTGTTVTTSVTNVIQNVIKFEESVLSTEGDLRPPSPLVSPPKHSSDSSPALILASLDKSILQIRDWLTLMEQMTRQQTVVVGDAENIRQLTEKQKSVLRELEGKKPQLDELVASADSLKDDASRSQLHQKVSKLREHWDETNSVVLARKTQLDAMYGDTHKFDAKRSELESWLSRMEARLERMAPVAHTADVLDQQIREQKGFHAEIHQYKHQVELFNQMTQRLIAIYQHDDTRKLKKITETINLRYSSLNSSIIARGKALHSAMNSLHNFDKALDKFASWMSDAESNTDLIELEVDKLGPARRDPQARGPAIRLKLAHYSSYDQLQYKDLQSEIESHKDVLASLNATGQKLLGTLENQDEAVMLQRRLEEMKPKVEYPQT
ncbi:microtubule-actin cross-linking factor 1-like [Palaemon carinicauda]|uniref:microtubule-actin cross-linking factor 1-like n=1 Tax=Palaemon carinicauda TaxID=392227 RepID=UPI0035B61F4C